MLTPHSRARPRQQRQNAREPGAGRECVINLPHAALWRQVERSLRSPAATRFRPRKCRSSDSGHASSRRLDSPRSSLRSSRALGVRECPLQLEAIVRHIRRIGPEGTAPASKHKLCASTLCRDSSLRVPTTSIPIPSVGASSSTSSATTPHGDDPRQDLPRRDLSHAIPSPGAELLALSRRLVSTPKGGP